MLKNKTIYLAVNNICHSHELISYTFRILILLLLITDWLKTTYRALSSKYYTISTQSIIHWISKSYHHTYHPSCSNAYIYMCYRWCNHKFLDLLLFNQYFCALNCGLALNVRRRLVVCLYGNEIDASEMRYIAIPSGLFNFR